MKIIESISDFKNIEKGCVLTIGNFDGVHLGHQEILTAARQTANKRQTQLVAMTFEPHPLAILYPQKAPDILTPLDLKKNLLAEFGVDCLFVQKTDPDLLALSPQDYVEQFIVKGIQPGIVIEGESFNFGSDRTGNSHLLGKLGVEKGFEVSVIKAKKVKLPAGQVITISSSIIRNMLGTGKVVDAAISLGRPYRLIGQIVRGHGKGKKLGFPTLNLQPLNQLIPAEGVYAGLVEIGDSAEYVCAAKEKIPAAFSIGRAETLESDYPTRRTSPTLIEAHILSGDVGDLYGKWLAMDFIERIRSQQKFGSKKDLSAQIAKDCKKAKQVLCPAKVQK
jgi:riboflavin kinase/FMN adenylyltransferase